MITYCTCSKMATNTEFAPLLKSRLRKDGLAEENAVIRSHYDSSFLECAHPERSVLINFVVNFKSLKQDLSAYGDVEHLKKDESQNLALATFKKVEVAKKLIKLQTLGKTKATVSRHPYSSPSFNSCHNSAWSIGQTQTQKSSGYGTLSSMDDSSTADVTTNVRRSNTPRPHSPDRPPNKSNPSKNQPMSTDSPARLRASKANSTGTPLNNRRNISQKEAANSPRISGREIQQTSTQHGLEKESSDTLLQKKVDGVPKLTKMSDNKLREDTPPDICSSENLSPVQMEPVSVTAHSHTNPIHNKFDQRDYKLSSGSKIGNQQWSFCPVNANVLKSLVDNNSSTDKSCSQHNLTVADDHKYLTASGLENNKSQQNISDRHIQTYSQEVDDVRVRTYDNRIQQEYSLQQDNLSRSPVLDPEKTFISNIKMADNLKRKSQTELMVDSNNSLSSLVNVITNSPKMTTISKDTGDIYVLLLGETGVGKSTFINALYNYSQFTNLQEASKKDVIALIPILYSAFDKSNYTTRKISIGSDENERAVAGMSCTKSPRTYDISINGMVVHLIDTPGLGDTQGYDQDKKHFRNLLRYIRQFSVLHGILIMLKPGDIRISISLKYYISELLTILHREACSNILFCFTSSQSNQFEPPADAIVPLREFLKNNGADIQFDKHTIYCFDNECVRYLAGVQCGLQYSDEHRKMFSSSWERSAEEAKRLFRHIASCRPHSVNDMLLITDVRQITLFLIKQLKYMDKIIRDTLNKINASDLTSVQRTSSTWSLAGKLYIPQVEVHVKPLDATYKVCTSAKCMKCIVSENTREIEYECMRLQKHSYFKGKNSTCDNCHCPSETHIKITHTTKHIDTMIESPTVMKEMEDSQKETVAQVEYRTRLRSICEELRYEQQIICKASARFAFFLQRNALSPYNDQVDEYLTCSIQTSRRADSAESTESLEKMRSKYRSELQSLDDLMKTSSIPIRPSSANDIRSEIDRLCQLKHVGKIIEGLLAPPTQPTTYRLHL